MKRGHLRIYVGFAAGVGKTFAMLGEGHRRRDRGTDVVIGFVESHGRPMTEDAIGDLEIVPRRTIDYRGAAFEEMDVDAIIARAPDVVLVDELAHTNVPGSEHEKRWQDVDLILEAGIDVISTVNIQHLESLNDVVERITGVRQRETIPDEIVRAADQQELVDMTPYALRRRMAHGNIYPPEKIDAALGNYFREGNLGALRELALLWMADRVDESLQDYMKDRGIEGPWETRERILVGVAGRAEDGMLIRRAARMAARRGGDLVAVNIIPEDGLAETGAIDGTRELVRTVGGTFREVIGARDPGGAAGGRQSRERHPDRDRRQLPLAMARVLPWIGGAPDHPRLRSHRCPRDRPGHVVGGGEPAAAPLAPGSPGTADSPDRWWGRSVSSLLTVVLASSRQHLSLSSVILLYLTLVVGVAAIGGIWPAVMSAIASGCSSTGTSPSRSTRGRSRRPRTSWRSSSSSFVASVVSVLVDRAARARARRSEAGPKPRRSPGSRDGSWPKRTRCRCCSLQLRDTFGLEAVSVLRPEGQAWVIGASAGPAPPTVPAEASDVIELERRRGPGAARRSPAGGVPAGAESRSRRTWPRRCVPATSARRRPRRPSWWRSTNCAPPSSRRSPTTCGRRWHRSRPRRAACGRTTSRGARRRPRSSSPRSRRRPTGSA